MEAVKQGSTTLGLKSKTQAVLIALKRAQSDLSAHQKKIYPIDDHIAVSIAGLTADGRALSKFMRTECLNSKFLFDQPLPVSRLVASVGNKSQWRTMFAGGRPYGVGMLVAGYDSQGPHIFQTCPSSNFYDCKSMAIGARSQAARTYFEKNMDEFLDCSLDELIGHGLVALRECLPADAELSSKNVSIAVMGRGEKVKMYDDDLVQPFLDALDTVKGGRGTTTEEPMSEDQPPPTEEAPAETEEGGEKMES